MELEDLEGRRSQLQADKDAHAAKVNRARCAPPLSCSLCLSHHFTPTRSGSCCVLLDFIKSRSFSRVWHGDAAQHAVAQHTQAG